MPLSTVRRLLVSIARGAGLTLLELVVLCALFGGDSLDTGVSADLTLIHKGPIGQTRVIMDFLPLPS